MSILQAGKAFRGAKPLCHPGRREHRDGRCRECVALAGLIGLGRDSAPFAVTGLQQRGWPTPLDRCPKCNAGEPAWVIGSVRSFCRMCGADSYRTGQTLDKEKARIVVLYQNVSRKRRHRTAE